MMMMNYIGEIESPCLRPRAWAMRCPGWPLKRTLVLAVDRRMEIQFVHLLEKLICCRTSRRKGQAMESKALVISVLTSIEGFFLAWSQRHASCTKWKLSWMAQPLMNALWLLGALGGGLEIAQASLP